MEEAQSDKETSRSPYDDDGDSDAVVMGGLTGQDSEVNSIKGGYR